MAENKYLFDLDAELPFESTATREERRKKHKQSRIIAWVFTVIIMCAAGSGIFFGLKSVFDKGGPKPPTESVVSSTSTEVPDDMDEVLGNLIGGETEIVTPPETIEPVITEDELFEDAVRSYVQSMPLDEQVASLFIVTPEQLTGVNSVTKAGNATKEALSDYTVGGIYYTSSNMKDEKQFKELVEGTKSFAKYPLFLAMDYELGASSLPKKMNAPSTSTAREIGEGADPVMARVEEEKIASYLSGLGINFNLGVVADVNVSGESSFMKDRSFGADLDVVTPMVTKTIEALTEYDIFSAVKYFPGQASANADPSNAISTTERTLEEMKGCEFVPFVEAVASGAKAIVVSHVSAPNAFGDSMPASQSKVALTDIIRMELDLYDVIIISDELTKSSISEYYEAQDACIKSIKAGADMILSPGDFRVCMASVLEAVSNGVIAKERIEDSLVRIFKVKFEGMTHEQVSLLASPSEEE